MHSHSYSQDSTLSGWSESSSLQPKSGREQQAGAPARSFKKNLFGAGLALATGVLPVYFLVFASLAYRYDGARLEDSPIATWLLEAARFGPSVFPIVFAAIIGQLMTALASWRLEKDIAIGALEYLLASRSLASALLALPRLQIICIWTPAILLTWCLSPLGGQATLRAVSPSVSHTLDSAWLVHLDFNGSQPISTYANDASSFGGVIRSAYVAALAGPNSTKQGSQDAFDNLHIPMLEAQSGQADENGWYNTTAAESAVNVALIGIPFSGAEQHGNSGFIMQTSYFYLDCATAMSSWKRRNETTA